MLAERIVQGVEFQHEGWLSGCRRLDQEALRRRDGNRRCSHCPTFTNHTEVDSRHVPSD